MSETPLRVIITALGTRSAGKSVFRSCSVNAEAEHIAKRGVEVLPFAFDDVRTPMGLVKNAYYLRRFIKKTKPHIIHSHYGSSTALITLLGGLFLSPLIVSICGDDLLETPTSRWKDKMRAKLAILLTRFCVLFCRKVIVKSRNLFDALSSAGKEIAVIQPNGVNTRLFTSIDKKMARAKLSLDEKDVIVLFNKSNPGNQDVKCPELARKAFEAFKNKVPNAFFLELSSEGFERIPLFMNAADVLLITSLHEGSPNVVKEAMACNLPVVTVDCGDVVERLSRVSPSFVVARSVDQLASAMVKACYGGKRSNGREEIFRQGLDKETTAKNIMSLYQNAVQEEPSIKINSSCVE